MAKVLMRHEILIHRSLPAKNVITSVVSSKNIDSKILCRMNFELHTGFGEISDSINKK